MHYIKTTVVSLLFVMASLISVAGTGDNKGDKGSAETGIKHLTKADFLVLVMDYVKNPTEWKYSGKKPCIIDFYADWCGPCRMASPILEELAVTYKDKIDVYKINVDQEKELSQVFNVTGIPAMLYCPMEGRPSMTSGVGQTKEQTKEMIKKYIETILLKNTK